MTLSCNCDMPIEIYCDWLQDQGWDCDELRAYCQAEEYGTCYYEQDGESGTGHEWGHGHWLDSDFSIPDWENSQTGSSCGSNTYGDGIYGDGINLDEGCGDWEYGNDN